MVKGKYLSARMKVVLHSICILAFFNIIGSYRIKKYSQIDQLWTCNNTDKTFVDARDFNLIKRRNEDTLINYVFIVLRDIKKLKLEIKLTKCNNADNLDSCEVYADLKPKNPCVFINMKNTAWRTVLDAYQPELVCPIKKDTYHVINATFNADAFNLFPTDNAYWRMKLGYSDGPNVEFASCLAGRIISTTLND